MALPAASESHSKPHGLSQIWPIAFNASDRHPKALGTNPLDLILTSTQFNRPARDRVSEIRFVGLGAWGYVPRCGFNFDSFIEELREVLGHVLMETIDRSVLCSI